MTYESIMKGCNSPSILKVTLHHTHSWAAFLTSQQWKQKKQKIRRVKGACPGSAPSEEHSHRYLSDRHFSAFQGFILLWVPGVLLPTTSLLLLSTHLLHFEREVFIQYNLPQKPFFLIARINSSVSEHRYLLNHTKTHLAKAECHFLTQ